MLKWAQLISKAELIGCRHTLPTDMDKSWIVLGSLVRLIQRATGRQRRPMVMTMSGNGG